MNTTASPTQISQRELKQIEHANASKATPVVFIHGLWLLPSSWDPWMALFEEAGYAALTPDWPDDPGTVEQARANPKILARKTLKQVADHTTEIINALDKKPAVIGHSTGGLLAQMLAGRGLSAATVAIDPGVFRGVLPLPLSVLKGVGPFLVNPLTRGRAITLTLDQFKYGWANALGEKEAKELYQNREDPEPWPLPHDRPRLARGRRDGAQFRQAVRLACEAQADAKDLTVCAWCSRVRCRNRIEPTGGPNIAIVIVTCILIP